MVFSSARLKIKARGGSRDCSEYYEGVLDVRNSPTAVDDEWRRTGERETTDEQQFAQRMDKTMRKGYHL